MPITVEEGGEKGEEVRQQGPNHPPPPSRIIILSVIAKRVIYEMSRWSTRSTRLDDLMED